MQGGCSISEQSNNVKRKHFKFPGDHMDSSPVFIFHSFKVSDLVERTYNRRSEGQDIHPTRVLLLRTSCGSISWTENPRKIERTSLFIKILHGAGLVKILGPDLSGYWAFTTSLANSVTSPFTRTKP
jgi:hypothetical protein